MINNSILSFKIHFSGLNLNKKPKKTSTQNPFCEPKSPKTFISTEHAPQPTLPDTSDHQPFANSFQNRPKWNPIWKERITKDPYPLCGTRTHNKN
jgi:hypothetical protein